MTMRRQRDPDIDSSFPAHQERRQHYCRGCGRELPLGCRQQFHRECLHADKRGRVREQRRREQERFQRMLENLRCPNCGARYGDGRSDGAREGSCEASQPIQETRSNRPVRVGAGDLDHSASDGPGRGKATLETG